MAAGRTDEEVREIIGADWLIYQDLDDLVHAVRHDNAKIEEFDTSCFSGEYVTGDVTPEYLGAPAARALGRGQAAASRWRRSRPQIRPYTVEPALRMPAPGPAVLSLRLLVIADRAEYRLLARKHVEIQWPDAGVFEHRLGEDSRSTRSSPPRATMRSSSSARRPTDVGASSAAALRLSAKPGIRAAGARAAAGCAARSCLPDTPRLQRLYGRKIDRERLMRAITLASREHKKILERAAASRPDFDQMLPIRHR